MMKRGLYDVELRPNTFREVALLYHEIEQAKIQYRETLLRGFDVESPDEALKELKNSLLPGSEEQKERTMAERAEYIRSLQDVDWSEVFSLVDEPDSHRDSDPLDKYK